MSEPCIYSLVNHTRDKLRTEGVRSIVKGTGKAHDARCWSSLNWGRSLEAKNTMPILRNPCSLSAIRVYVAI